MRNSGARTLIQRKRILTLLAFFEAKLERRGLSHSRCATCPKTVAGNLLVTAARHGVRRNDMPDTDAEMGARSICAVNFLNIRSLKTQFQMELQSFCGLASGQV